MYYSKLFHGMYYMYYWIATIKAVPSSIIFIINVATEIPTYLYWVQIYLRPTYISTNLLFLIKAKSPHVLFCFFPTNKWHADQTCANVFGYFFRKPNSCRVVQSAQLYNYPSHKYHSRSKQRTGQRVLVLTLKFLALKKLVFWKKKFVNKVLCNFSVLRYNV